MQRPISSHVFRVERAHVFLVAFFVLACLSVPLLGGHPARLSTLRLERSWIPLAALGIQVLIVSVIPRAFPAALAVLHGTSYALAGWFVWLNRRVPGLPILGAGWALNALVIFANAGVMPAARHLAHAGSRGAGVANEFLNSRPLPAPRLSFLGDNFSLPQSWPFHNVFSAGDVLIALGAFVGLHWICGSLVARTVSRGWAWIRSAATTRIATTANATDTP